jgi:hypothetical protein
VLFSAPLGILLLSCLAAGAWREKPARWGRALTLLAPLVAIVLVRVVAELKEILEILSRD